jgi:hypothetical protein
VYLACGLHPIPLEPGGKTPLVSWRAFQTMAPTARDLEAWWGTTPDANVGLVLGRGTYAVDCDSPEAWAMVEHLVPDGALWVTTAKGRHVYLRGDQPDRVGVLPGVDVRGVGYVVAPPSIHPSGVPYAWASGGASNPADWPRAPAIEALLARPAPRVLTTAGEPGWVAAALAGVETGRNDMLARLVGYFHQRGLRPDEIEVLARQWVERCGGDHPFTDTEFRATLASILARDGGPPTAPAGIAEAVMSALAKILAPASSRRVSPTGVGLLDAALDGGFEPGDYVVLGARPAVGKSLLASWIARRLGQRGQGVLYVTLEMSVFQATRRLLVQDSQVRAVRVKTQELDDSERAQLELSAARLSLLPLWITTAPRTVDDLERQLDDFQPGQLGLVVCDYLQRMRAGGLDGRARVEAVSAALRQVALDRDVPVLALSSLSRPARDDKNWFPRLTDLRESGAIEHDASVALLAHRDVDGGNPALTVHVAKNRDGVSGAMLHLPLDLERLQVLA